MVGDRVEKDAVVSNDQQRSGIPAQMILEPHHRVEVQVVRRFVEQQQIRSAHQRLREIQPDPPAAGEFAIRSGEVARCKPEAVEDRRSARRCGVATQIVELCVQIGKRSIVAAPLRVGDRSLDAA